MRQPNEFGQGQKQEEDISVNTNRYIHAHKQTSQTFVLNRGVTYNLWLGCSHSQSKLVKTNLKP
jgi:hypothetical protein